MFARKHLISVAMTFVILTAVTGASAQETTHTVVSGDNLYRIAELYGVTVSALAQTNDIAYTWRIVPGDSLLIPTTTSNEAESAVEVAAAPALDTATEYHTVTWGESLGTVARLYGMTLDALARLNDITNPDLIYVGQQLIVSTSQTDDTNASTIGDAAATALDAMVEAAAPAPAPLMPSYSVILPPSAELAVTSSIATIGTTQHIVTYGESLSAIARRYSVSMLAITQANNIYDANTIYIGQELAIPEANMSVIDAGVSTVAAAPASTLTMGREVIIDLSDQRIYAYENGVLVRNVLVSTGLPATPTVRGEFTAQRKYAAQTMTGPGYYLPDVPYVVYFYAGYALHGTYWHENFGQPMSHGCVNLPTPEAEWFYNFADIGTPINVQA